MKSKKAVKAQIAEDQEVGVKAAEVQETVKTSTADFSIAGIGVSAGGLEALEQFLRNVPEIGGIAVIATGTKSDRTTPPAFPRSFLLFFSPHARKVIPARGITCAGSFGWPR